MHLLLPELALKMFLKEKTYTIEQYYNDPAKQTEFEAWYIIKRCQHLQQQ